MTKNYVIRNTGTNVIMGELVYTTTHAYTHEHIYSTYEEAEKAAKKLADKNAMQSYGIYELIAVADKDISDVTVTKVEN